MWEVLLYITLGQLVLLILLTTRQGWDSYRRALTGLWIWLGALAVFGLLNPIWSGAFALFTPLALYFFSGHFFEKPLRRSYLVWMIIPIGIIAGLVFYSDIFRIIGLTYYLLESGRLLWLLSKHQRHRGISFRSMPDRFGWLLYLILFVTVASFCAFINIGWPLEVLKSSFVSSYFLAVTGSAWFLTKSDAIGPLKAAQKYTSSTLDQPETFRILSSLDQQVSEDYLLKPGASLAELARKLHTTPHQLSQVLNESKGMSFFELMAQMRVRAARKLLRNEDYQHLTIEQIGEAVGYLSKSSFNTVFKKITGHTPSEYRSGDVRHDDLERLEQPKNHTSWPLTRTLAVVNNTTSMLSSFFKIYLRSLLKNPLFSTINLVGLIVGFTSCLLIFLYLNDELSYDTFHKDAENIYRIALITPHSPQTRTPHPMAQQLVADFPEVVSAVTFTPLYGPGLTLQSIYIRNPENNIMIREPGGFAADSTFFDVFDFKLVAGNSKTALSEPGAIVITESMAKEYFGDENPMGRLLEAPSNGVTGMITGVMQDPPANSHFHPRFIISYMSLKADPGNRNWMSWSDPGHFNYIKLAEGTDPKALEVSIADWILQFGDQVQPDMFYFVKEHIIYFALQPLTDIHLNSHLRWELESNSSMTYIYILYAVILFIAVIISINFINLNTARGYERSKEVGIRKSLGASRASITFQYIAEAVATCLFALLFALLLAALLLEPFNNLTEKTFERSLLFDPMLLTFFTAAVLVIGGISGFYPSLTFVKIKPVEVLKGKFLNQSQGRWRRSLLITVQFIAGAALIFGSLVIRSQVHFLESQPLGFDDDHLVVMELHTGDEIASLDAIKSELLNEPGVLAVGGISNLPGGQFNQNDLFFEETPQERIPASELWVDYDALQVLGLSLKEGRWFDRSVKGDSSGTNYIINTVAMAHLGLTGIDKPVYWYWEAGAHRGNVVGIVNDFNYQSLHIPIQPLVVAISSEEMNYLLIRVSAQNIQQTLNRIEQVHRSFDERFVADISFLDDQLNMLYASERKAFAIFNLFGLIALMLAAMGLLGIAYLVITQRTKEVGVRKVLGARTIDLLWMENKTFLKIVGIALIIGIPLAYYIMQGWLNEFAYSTTIGLSSVLVTILILAVVSLFSVSFAVLRTLLRNPSNALRYE